MNLVDSCGWLEYFADGPNAGFFSAAVEDVDQLLVPTICLLEVFKRVFKQADEAPALQAVTNMQEGGWSNSTRRRPSPPRESAPKRSSRWPTASSSQRRAPTTPCCGRRMPTSRLFQA